jgi:hypothetical protein
MLFPAWGQVRLNNLVGELPVVGPETRAAEIVYRFTNPRQGWVYIRCEARANSEETVRLSINEAPDAIGAVAHEAGPGRPLEAMRLLDPGEHAIHVVSGQSSPAVSPTVRAVPAILYSKFPDYPSELNSCPVYDWDYLSGIGMLDTANVLISREIPRDHPEFKRIEGWRNQGRRWVCNSPVIGNSEEVSSDEAYRYWTSQWGLRAPGLDGLIVDEFTQKPERYSVWSESIARAKVEAGSRDFVMYLAGYAETLRDLLRPLVGTGVQFAYERYMSERPTEDAMRAFIREELIARVADFNREVPGFNAQGILVLGFFCGPRTSLNKDPGADFKVQLDMQFEAIANEPACEGLYGIMAWTSDYADEEYLRWLVRLYRHYCIEGRTERLGKDPYRLDHIRNPDFEQGLEGWTVEAATPDSVSVGRKDWLGFLEGRYPEDHQGDTYLLLTRSATGPNRIRQTIRNLEPGKTYSVKMFSVDKDNPTAETKHPLAIRIERADLIPERSFQDVYPNHPVGEEKHGFGLENPARINYHYRVFRARSDNAELVISDWPIAKTPDGFGGKRFMCNFFEVEPYYLE